MLIKEEKGLITFIFEQKVTNQVYLTGDFNAWETTNLPLKEENAQWKLTIELKPGAYEFKYYTKLENGEERWFNDWKADAYVASPYGGENSVVIIE